MGGAATRSIATQYATGAATGMLAASSLFPHEDGRARNAGELTLDA